MLKLLVIEDHALVREGLLQTLSKLEPGIVCVGAQDAEEALRLLELDGGDDYDLCLLDLMLPGLNGMGCLGVLRKRYPAMPVVVISALDDPDTVARAMRAGASGFVSKSSPGAEMFAALRQVLAGEVYLPTWLRDESSGQRGRRSRTLEERYLLSAAQMRVLEPLIQGKTNRQIADLLGLSEGTVKIHVSAILKALNVSNRSQALLAVRQYKSSRLPA